MMFNDKPQIPRPGIEIAGGRVEPDLIKNPDTGKRVPGIRFTKKFAAGGQAGYRKVADGCAKRGKTRGKMV
jgi:hypothetical protein